MISCQEENLLDIIHEIVPLIPEHWEEVGSHKQLECNVGWYIYLDIEEKGKLVVVTMREDKNLIGYVIGALTPDLHRVYPGTAERVMICSQVVYYVVPNKRAFAWAMMRRFEQVAVVRGAGVITARAKRENNAGAFIKALGYKETETTYTKLVGKAAHVGRIQALSERRRAS